MSRGDTRRGFLADVGRGMLLASVGSGLAVDMGLAPTAWAEELADGPLTFGEREPLVRFMQETAPEELLPALQKKLEGGASLKELLTAAALANGRTFGGEDYIGFHTLMALGPAWHMAQELPEQERALPVFKVLYRNAARIRETGGHEKELLQAVVPLEGKADGLALREASRKLERARAEGMLAALERQSVEDAFNALLMEVEDETEVHRVALPYRAWDLMGIIGRDHALTFLRQSLRYCVKAEPKGKSATREVLARVFDQFGLEGKTPGDRHPDDEWIEAFSRTLLSSEPSAAAEAAAAALVEGIAPSAITEAAAVAANQILLRDPGRPEKYSSANKPPGSVHGDSIGLHCCDAVNAWRNIARVANARNQFAATILASYQVARDRILPGTDGERFIDREPLPLASDQQRFARAADPGRILEEVQTAIRSNDQAQAAAAVQHYGKLTSNPAPVFDLLRRYAVSEDGALHAEKYFRTATEEFASVRPRFRWNQLVALARVTASEHGYPAPGYAEACRLLGMRSLSSRS